MERGWSTLFSKYVVLKNDGIALFCLHFTEDVYNRARVDIFQEKPSEKDVNFQFENTKNRQYAETPYFFTKNTANIQKTRKNDHFFNDRQQKQVYI